MEIHKPKPVHNWRELLTEIGVIVIGVAIALAGEQTVEYFHHRSQLGTARRELAAELGENRQALAFNRNALRAMERELGDDMALLRGVKPSPGPLAGKLDYAWAFKRPRDGAWQIARQNGSLDLMPHDELQGYAHLYAVLGSFMATLEAHGRQMDRAAAVAERAKDGAVSTRDIEDMVAATTAARGVSIDLERALVFEEQAFARIQAK